MSARAVAMRAARSLGLAAMAGLLAAAPAHGHAFGERYDLPLPLGLYIGGAAAAVVVSFAAVALFLRDVPWSGRYPRFDLLGHPLGRLAAHPAVLFVLKLASVALFTLVVAAGFMGAQDPYRNIAPVLVWIVWWVGMAIFSAFVGDLWAVINPWRTAFAWAEAIWRRIGRGRLSRDLPYPESAGVWPAVFLLGLFAWSELISSRPASPAYIAWMALAYSALTWAGMALFGRERWLRQGEVFSVVFAVLARFAPTETRIHRADVCTACGLGCRDRDGVCINCASCWERAAKGDRAWALRPPAVGLLRNERISSSMIALIVLYLVAVIFDGVLATPAWQSFEIPLAGRIPLPADAASMAIRTGGLFGFWLFFLGLYLLTCRAMAALVEDGPSAGQIARRFVPTLVPIAIAYHLAHYLGYLLVQGQYAIPLASDPLGRGWDLFGTAGYRVDIGVVGARFAWYTAVATIVAGHIVAVVLGHIQAIATFSKRRFATRSQYPLTAFMVALTVASLTIMAEPIVQKDPAVASDGKPTAVSVPADALVPEPGSGVFGAVGPGRTAAIKLRYGAMASPFHDGSQTTAADLVYPFAVAWRWGGKPATAGSGYDPGIDRATASIRRHLVGFKLQGRDNASKTIRFGDLTYAREQVLVDVYLSAAPDNVETTATLAPPWSPLPWHVVALMEEAVGRGWAAFSKAEADRLGIGWLDPVRTEPLKLKLRTLVEEFERNGYVPVPLVSMVTPDEARARWRALAAYHAQHGHFLVTNGPYAIKSWSAEATVLEVVRDPRYPLGVGSYDAYAIPRRGFVTGSKPTAQGLALSVEIEVIETTMRTYKIVRLPLKEAIAATGRRRLPDCRFVVVGADGKVAATGKARLGNDDAFAVDLVGALPPGRYTVLAAVYVNGNAVNAEVTRIPYEAK